MNISVNGLEKFFGEKQVLKGVNFDVFSGEKVGLVGPNGAGKTTLFKILMGSLEHEIGTISITRGAMIGLLDQIPVFPEYYTTIDVLKTAFDAVYQIQSEMREIEAQLEKSHDKYLLDKYGELQSRLETLGGYNIDNDISKVCNGLDIDIDMQGRSFSMLSGGEKTRVNLARLMLQSTDGLLLDEPTNHLDIESVEWLENYLIHYKGTVIVISHDRYFLDRVTTKTIEIDEGKAATYSGNYSFYIEEKQQRIEQQAAEYERQQKEITRLTESAEYLHSLGMEKLHRKAFSIEKRIDRMEKIDRPVIHRGVNASFGERQFSGEEVVFIKDVTKGFGEAPLFEKLDLVIHRDEHVALLGPNGCGKTTLIKIITGAEKPDSGFARLGDSVKYAYLQQEIKFPDQNQTVLDVVMTVLKLTQQSARNRLGQFHFFGDDVFKIVGSLSGGEKSRLRLCLIMASDVNLLILDEPTNHLDIASREWIEDAVREFSGTVLFVSHDRYFINKFADRICEIQNHSATIFEGGYDKYREYKERVKIQEAASQVVEKAEKSQKTNTNSNKRSEKYNEKRAAAVEKRIKALEDELKQLDLQIDEFASDYEKLVDLLDNKKKLEDELYSMYEEWESFAG